MADKTPDEIAAEKAAADAALVQAQPEATATADVASEDKPKGYNQATGEFVL